MDIIDVSFDNWYTVLLKLNWLAIIILFAVVGIVAWVLKKIIPFIFRHSVTIDQATLGIGNSSVTIKYNRKDQEIAYKLWVELSTRKIGLMFEEDDDVIEEVYNSWYQFFGIARELLKDIPVERLSYSGELVNISQKVLNEGLRPHLTKWQARFRKWYDQEKSKNSTEDPQVIQKQFPQYDELVKDLVTTNTKMIEYMNCLHRIAFNEK